MKGTRISENSNEVIVKKNQVNAKKKNLIIITMANIFKYILCAK